MALNDILIGAPVTATGGVMHAPVGTAFPKTLAEEFSKDWVKGGYVGEDGVTRTIDANDDKIKAWGGDIVRILRSEHSVSYTFQSLESRNAETLKILFGEANVHVSDGEVVVDLKSEMVPRRAFAFDMRDGDAKIREEVPDGQISLSGDVQFVHSDIIRYEVTIEAFPDENGVKARSRMGVAKGSGATVEPSGDEGAAA
ncbi:hypothetical protein DHOM_02925 [Dermabacter hominis 1368]|uniref:Major tail protein n=1 Tax=Dermabacter hominis 1368 TaxID=1450519 RepID=A0ABR4SLR7_9MICO|nr:hypothetical protein DHOM_02925 [Dermabacter hominis 1368]